MGTLDTWLIWKWSRGSAFVTDSTTASRTLLMDIRARRWDPGMLGLFRVSPEWLAPVAPPMGALGMAVMGGLEVPILASAVDQQAALYGQCCFRAGQAKCTFGTGAFLLMHTGAEPVFSRRGLLTTVACARGRKAAYALDGGVYVAGGAVNWLRDIGLVSGGVEAARLAASVPDAGGVTFLPAFAGLAAPYWNRSARGLIHGLTGATTRAHIVRAMCEGIALRVAEVAELMERESGSKLTAPLRVDGGLSRNEFLMRFLAGLLQLPVETPESPEATALGIAYMAGLEAGLFAGEKDLAKLWRPGRRYDSSMTAAERDGHLARHRRAIRRLLAWDSDYPG